MKNYTDITWEHLERLALLYFVEEVMAHKRQMFKLGATVLNVFASIIYLIAAIIYFT